MLWVFQTTSCFRQICISHSYFLVSSSLIFKFIRVFIKLQRCFILGDDTKDEYITTEYFHCSLQKSRTWGFPHNSLLNWSVLCPCQGITSVPKSFSISHFPHCPPSKEEKAREWGVRAFNLGCVKNSWMPTLWPSSRQSYHLATLLYVGPSCSQPGQSCQGHVSRGSGLSVWKLYVPFLTAPPAFSGG